MDETFRLGRIRGITIGLNWTVLVIVWLLMWSLATVTLPETAPGYADGVYWSAGLAGALGLLGSILAHELSHALVARRHGVIVEGITLWMFGGVARLGSQARDARTELRIALAGPAMSLAIGVACSLGALGNHVASGPGLLTAALGWLGLINVVLAVFNLLPGAPLDGGRVLAAILWHRSGDERAARRQAARAGSVVGQVLIALGILEVLAGAGIGGIWLALIGWFLTNAAHAEEAQVDMLAAFEGVKVADIMSTDVHTFPADRCVADFVRDDAMSVHAGSFPLLDREDRLAGLVTLRRLRQVPAEEWAATRLGDVAIPVERLAIAHPGEPVVEVLTRAGSADGRVVVVDDGRLVGIVTPTDVTSALERLLLARTRPPVSH
jgi:Zn-dependent protease